MASKQKQILVISGIEFILFPKIQLMMMLQDVQSSRIPATEMQGVSTEGEKTYFSQKASKQAASYLARKSSIPGLRVPSLEEWLLCVDQVQTLSKREYSHAPYATEYDNLITTRLLQKDIHGMNAISELRLSHNGYRYANTNIHCQSPNDGRYWTSTPKQYIHLNGSQMSLDCITDVKRGFSLRLVADIPSEVTMEKQEEAALTA